ncbi:hypothetical protein MesoLjLa_18360 [Mesorhizobium sp. L-2-11]|nr:hypothetical protein MesoLjLa_18360 [Mesorhizobium sp. L-2-11]
MKLLRIALLCTGTISVAMPAVRAEDQLVPPNHVEPPQPAVHCEGQNCLPPADDPVEECKGQNCSPAPPVDAGAQIEQVD